MENVINNYFEKSTFGIIMSWSGRLTQKGPVHDITVAYRKAVANLQNLFPIKTAGALSHISRH